MADPVIQLPYRIIAVDEDLPIRLQRNFDEIVRLLGMLQVYENKTGKVINEQVAESSDVWDRANNITAEGKWLTSKLEGAIDTALNLVLAGAGNVTITDNNGILIVDNKDAPTRALRLLGGVFAIANSKKPDGTWDWRTFGTGDGFTADEIVSGKILTSLVNIVGDKYFTKILGDGFRVYDKTGSLAGHFGHYQTLADQIATFTRNSVAYKQDGSQVAANQPRFEYHTLPAPVWRDTFDTDQLSQYTSGGDVAATWTVSDGVLAGTDGNQATLTKNDLLLQDCEIVVNSDQVGNGGIIARYQDNNNYYLLALSDDSGQTPSHNLRLLKRVGGTFTQFATADVTWPRDTTKQIKFTLHGSRLEAYFGGVKVISVTDTTFTGGGVGLRNSSATAFRVLDFTVYYAVQGVMAEEAGSNELLNGSFETDLTEWENTGSNHPTSVRDTSKYYYGSASAKVTFTGVNSCFAQNMVSKKATLNNVTIAYSAMVWTTATNVNLQIQSNYSTVVSGNAATPSHPGTGQWVKLSGTVKLLFDQDGTTTYINATLAGQTAETVAYVDGFKVEIKAYDLSYCDTTRSAEVLTAPSSVFQKGNWTIDLLYTPTSNPATGIYNRIWEIQIGSDNRYYLGHTPDGKLACDIVSGGTHYGISDTTTLTVGQTYLIMLSGNGSVLRLCKNGVQIGTDRDYVEPVGTLPTNMYIGSNIYGAAQANGIISDFAVMSKAQTLAEHQAEYWSGLPLQVDEYTTYLMSCNGTLQPTVRGFGLWTKNGRFILQDPQKGQGIEVWDGSTRKVLIGRLDDGTIGQEIVGGKLYSSEVQTGTKDSNTYVALVPPNGFVVMHNGQKVLETWANSYQGHLFWYESGVKYGQISAYSDKLHINTENDKGLYLQAGGTGITEIYGYKIDMYASSMFNFTGRYWNSFLPYINNSGYIGNNDYKWNTVRATFVTQGDLCFEERTCPICEQPFADGDTLVLLVKTIHEEHHTMTIPIHERCKGIQKTIAVEVPETEERYRLKENGEVETYRVSKFEEVEEKIHQVKEGYSLDKTTGNFRKDAVFEKKLKEYHSAVETEHGLKYFDGLTGKEVSMREAHEDVEMPKEQPVTKDEAIELVTVKRHKPVMKTIVIEIGKAGL